MRSHAARAFSLICVTCSFVVLAGCGGDSPSTPGDDEAPRLAGGGRQSDGDSFHGGGEVSGPTDPGIPDIESDRGFVPVFWSETSCFREPFERLLADSASFGAWWHDAVSCLPDVGGPDEPPPPGLPDDEEGDDSGATDPDPIGPWNPYGSEAPSVDFTSHVVVAIGIEADTLWGRSAVVTSITAEGGATVISYEVVHPGEDCLTLLMRPLPIVLEETTPVVAVVVPRPVEENVSFARTDTEYHCTWVPEPNEPLTLYYTDADCDLGPTEAVISDEDSWTRWFETAVACDQARWGWPGDPTHPDGSIGSDGAPVPVDPPTRWAGIDVDFSTHAVVILRAEAQARWGGGVWLNAVETGPAGTTIDYSVMALSEDCPPVEDGAALRPSAAIRLPLPLPAPVTFRRAVETIRCDWDPGPGDPPRPDEPPPDDSDGGAGDVDR